ncbi:hypothetical protein GC088_09910 [Arthrobacter sp. JZ12]|uniref:hypothetical protein n=1 Tax=Arthrobacter sp. JZ12 TaxID=2654190 RepID=UPI002B47C213|nr:hypothetical protein [Arthrobacter sp. JZ12]WRH25344.1 hypothetical protein GC088_09910 [Arthrobacter sp. JZ12]
MATKSSSADPALAGMDEEDVDLACRVVGGVVGTAASGGVALAASAGAPATGGASLVLWLAEAQVGFFAGWFAEEVCNAIFDDERPTAEKDEGSGTQDGGNRSGGDTAGDSTYPNPEDTGHDEIDLAVAAATLSVLTNWRTQTSPLLDQYSGAYGPLKIPPAVMAGYWQEPPGGWNTPALGEEAIQAKLAQRIQPVPPEVADGAHVTVFAQASPGLAAFGAQTGPGGLRRLQHGYGALLDSRGLAPRRAMRDHSSTAGRHTLRRVQDAIFSRFGR